MKRRVYFDSSLWVSYFLPNDKNNIPPKEKVYAQQQILKIVHNGDKLLVSTLVLLELIDRIRDIIAENYDVNDIAQKRKEILNWSNMKVDQIISVMTKLEKTDFVNYVDSLKTVSNQHYEIYNLTHSYYWNIKPKRYDSKRKCVICGYDGAHHLDFYHAFCAVESNADEIITFDKGFDQLKTFEDFRSLQVSILNKP